MIKNVKICDSSDNQQLERMKRLMELLGNPQSSLKFIHVAGTNGKGSAASMISQGLISAGFKVGLYTSPHLQIINERIRVNGKLIDDKRLGELLVIVKEKAKTIDEYMSLFMIWTAIGFCYFKECGCDFVVMEAGIGGRTDVTNIVKFSFVNVIMQIGFDHTEKLGNTLTSIAGEKAGIIKHGSITVLYDQCDEVKEVIRKKCEEKESELIIANADSAVVNKRSLYGQKFSYKCITDANLHLLGKNQIRNAVVAIEALRAINKFGFSITNKNIKDGISKTFWAGRFELVNKKPDFIIDGGHNFQCVKSIIENIIEFFPQKKPVILTGVMRDKDFESMFDALEKVAYCFVAVSCDSNRAMPVDELSEFLERYQKPVYKAENIYEGTEKALLLAYENKTFAIAVGSMYLAGDVRNYMKLKSDERI